MGESRNMIAGLYDLEETIGEGHYAVVKLARHVFTGEKVAVKVIDKMKLDQSTRMQMLQEVRLMKLVQHPNVVRLYEVIDTQTKLYLVLELGDGGDMYDYIMKHEGGLGEDKARKYFRQIVTAIQYCHKLHVVHRDLKPENVVFFEKLGMVKLTDFGFSNKFNPGQRLLTSCGSLAYSAPEILLGDAYDAPAVDIWSLGVILYMLVCGAAPFQEANDSETLTMIMDCNYIVPSHISQQCQHLISSMLCRDPSKRATLDQISSNVWLSADPSVPLWDMLPLVTREHLSEEDHAHIIQKMVAGSIATREHIIDCLDRNDYNHVTATYFLLAERKLRAQRQDTARRAKDKTGDRKKVQQSKTTTSVESLLSPQDGESQVDISTLSITGLSNLSGMSNISTIKRNFNRVRKISIVEEEEEEEEDSSPDQAMPARGLSRHSSTSSLADKSAGGGAVSPQLHLDLTLAFAAQRLEDVGGEPSLPTPAPFPQSSQIGTGLSRQNSLRRSGESTSGSSPCSERKSTPGSPASPTAGHSSPARFKLSHSSSGGRKLVGARSSPQLGPLVMATHTTLPILNQIHEESEEGGNSPGEDRSGGAKCGVVGAPAGAAVLRRLEQRRRLHKSRTASCSSSDASDDDSENRKKRGGRAGYPAWRDNNDSSDSQDPPGGSGGGGEQGGFRSGGAPPSGEGGDGGGSSGSSGGHSEGGGLSGRHYRLHRNSNRVRQSYSLNRISELHETDFSANPGTVEECGEAEPGHTSSREETDSEVARKEETDSETQDRSRRQFTPQLSSESDGEPGNEILTRYLDSLGQGSGKLTRSRDDSLNSSDSEYAANDDDRRRSKVNLRQLEERLNMIQEECNRLSEESDDERSATIDDRSEKNENFDTIDDVDILDSKNNNDDVMSDCEEDTENRNTFDSVFSKIDQFLDNSRTEKRSSGRSRSEGWTFSDCEDSPRYRDRIIEIYSCRTKDTQYLQDKLTRTERRPKSERSINARGRPRSAPARTGKPLHRAHSCGSLMSRTNNGQCGGFWDLLSDKSSPITILSTNELTGAATKSTELTLTLTSVSAPLSLLHLQTGTSRCCNLC